MAQYQAIIQDAANISDSTKGTLQLKIQDTAVLTDNFIAKSYFQAQFIESILVSDSFTPARRINLTVIENVDIAEELNTKGLFNSSITDFTKVETYVTLYNAEIPYNDNDTWVINYETNSVSKYTRFTFNSFAKIGGKYYGANEFGLYELGTDENEDGETDNISTKITTGFIDPSGMGMKSNVREMELYVKNNGTMTLRAYASDDLFFDYQLKTTNDSIKGTRISMGRNRKAVYWQFELLNDQGTDFDLNDAKLYRLVSGRIT